jgi:hypothetical protein
MPCTACSARRPRSDQVRRLPLRRLSAEGVRRLSSGSSANPADLFTQTSGNPFFVHELLASAQGERVPPSIADAVLARVRRLEPAVQDGRSGQDHYFLRQRRRLPQAQ